MIDEERKKSFDNVEEFIKELRKLDKNFSAKMKEVKVIGGISKEHTLYYKGKPLRTQLPPRANSIFGYLIRDINGNKVNLKTEKPNRIKSDAEKEHLTNYLLELRETINKEIETDRSKQADKEQQAKNKP